MAHLASLRLPRWGKQIAVIEVLLGLSGNHGLYLNIALVSIFVLRAILLCISEHQHSYIN